MFVSSRIAGPRRPGLIRFRGLCLRGSGLSVGGNTESSAILRSSNRAPGPLLTKGTRLGTRARLLVRRNPYEKRKITVPGDAIFFSARALRVFGAGFWRCWPGRRRAYSSGNSQFRPTRPRPWPRSPSRCCPARCRRLSGATCGRCARAVSD